jgi:hypothetical protein
MPQEKTTAKTDRLGLAGAGSFKSMNFVQSISEEDEQCSRKKKKVILSWREGFRGEGVGVKSRILSIYDVTQLPHNGCRLPKKRRVQIVRNILELRRQERIPEKI